MKSLKKWKLDYYIRLYIESQNKIVRREQKRAWDIVTEAHRDNKNAFLFSTEALPSLYVPPILSSICHEKPDSRKTLILASSSQAAFSVYRKINRISSKLDISVGLIAPVEDFYKSKLMLVRLDPRLRQFSCQKDIVITSVSAIEKDNDEFQFDRISTVVLEKSGLFDKSEFLNLLAKFPDSAKFIVANSVTVKKDFRGNNVFAFVKPAEYSKTIQKIAFCKKHEKVRRIVEILKNATHLAKSGVLIVCDNKENGKNLANKLEKIGLRQLELVVDEDKTYKLIISLERLQKNSLRYVITTISTLNSVDKSVNVGNRIVVAYDYPKTTEKFWFLDKIASSSATKSNKKKYFISIFDEDELELASFGFALSKLCKNESMNGLLNLKKLLFKKIN